MKTAEKGKIDQAELAAIEKRLAAVGSVAEIRKLTVAAAKIAARARKVDDAAVLKRAFEAGRRLERAGGALLMKHGIGDLNTYVAARWLRLAALSPEAFKARLNLAEQRRQRPPQRQVLPSVKTIVSDWSVDELGFPTRTVQTADGPEPT